MFVFIVVIIPYLIVPLLLVRMIVGCLCLSPGDVCVCAHRLRNAALPRTDWLASVGIMLLLLCSIIGEEELNTA